MDQQMNRMPRASGGRDPALQALRDADFNWVRDLSSVWRDSPFHNEAIHPATLDDIAQHFFLRTIGPDTKVEGCVVRGAPGAGKTHLLGALRRRVWDRSGWFVLLDIVGITEFWQTAALGFVRSLMQEMPNGRAQYQVMLSKLIKSLGEKLDAAARREIQAWSRSDRGLAATLNLVQKLLHGRYGHHVLEHADTLRAVASLGSANWDAANLAYSWLLGLDVDPAKRAALGYNGPPPAPDKLVRSFSWLMSLTGPTLIAIDQIDAIISASNLLAGVTEDSTDSDELRARAIPAHR
jgi:hypothetical protein